MSTKTKVIVGVVSLIVLEALTFYAYSLLWLADGQPQNHGSRLLAVGAWVCIAAMLLEVVIVPLVLYRWVVCSRPS